MVGGQKITTVIIDERRRELREGKGWKSTATVASKGGAREPRAGQESSGEKKAASWAELQTGCDKDSRMQEG